MAYPDYGCNLHVAAARVCSDLASSCSGSTYQARIEVTHTPSPSRPSGFAAAHGTRRSECPQPGGQVDLPACDSLRSPLTAASLRLGELPWVSAGGRLLLSGDPMAARGTDEATARSIRALFDLPRFVVVAVERWAGWGRLTLVPKVT